MSSVRLFERRDDRSMARVEIFSGRERRRFWSEAQKLAILAEVVSSGFGVAMVARRHDVSPQQVYGWRRDFRRQVAARTGAGAYQGSRSDAGRQVGGAPPIIGADRRRIVCALGKGAGAHLGQIQTRRTHPLRPGAPRQLRAVPRRWPRRNRLQHRRAGDPAPDNYEKELTLRRLRRRWPDVGDHSDPADDGKDERRRSLRLAQANP